MSLSKKCSSQPLLYLARPQTEIENLRVSMPRTCPTHKKNATSAKVQLIFTLGKGRERKQTRNISGFIGRLAAAFIGFIT